MEYVLKQPTEHRAIIRLASQEMSQLSATSRKKFDKTYHDQFTGKLQAIFQAGVKNGEFRAINPSVATWALLGMMYPYFIQPTPDPLPCTLKPYARSSVFT
ncbi:MAG: hypothetical protein IPL71_17435 [Anaerolineales bacterium]|nr:hypothetical protein [Anaerolineales bacterium]